MEFETKATVKKIKGKMIAVASEEVLDREGEILSIDGWKLKNFQSNPVLLWDHNKTDRTLPIGKAENIQIKEMNGNKKLIFTPVFEKITKFGKDVSKFFEEGLLNTFSVGFLPLKKGKSADDPTYIEQELLEISAVPVPALPTAQIIVRAKEMGIDKKATEEIFRIQRNANEVRNIEKKLRKEFDKKLSKQIKYITNYIKQKSDRPLTQSERLFKDQDLIDALKIINQAVTLALKKCKNITRKEVKQK
jgi:HK97 family phage prohead protease